MAFGRGDVGLSGRMGNRVYRQVGGETIVSAMPIKVDPRTPKQLASRAHLTEATRLWGELPLDAIDRWRLYGLRLGRRGDLVFRGLAAKYLQLHGGTSVPTEPPATPFAGDGIVVEATAAAVPPGGNPWSDGAVVFRAHAPNTPGVVTELLLQRLAKRYCVPKQDAYRTQAFVAFAGELVRVPARVGAWACAIRFVRADTGQASAVLPLGVIEVRSTPEG